MLPLLITSARLLALIFQRQASTGDRPAPFSHLPGDAEDLSLLLPRMRNRKVAAAPIQRPR
jgi:hypothetical protein